MLRVGLTGGLGSGKSTVAAMLGEMGAEVVSSDDLARGMMRPGEAVYDAIVVRFGAAVVGADGELDRAVLARVAFADGRVEELNAIVHPAVIARGAEIAGELAVRRPEAVLVVESALLFETRYGGEGGWRQRFDRVVLVVAPEAVRVERFAERAGAGGDAGALRAEARRRIARQLPDEVKTAWADWVVANDGSREDLRGRVEALWRVMEAEARGRR